MLIRVLDGASKIGALAARCCCFAVMALITIDVILRTLINMSIFGTVELSEFALVLIAFLAQAAAYTEGRHIAVDFFLQKASQRTSDILELVMLTLSIAIVVLMAVATIGSGIETIEAREISFALQLPIGWFKLAAGVGLILLSLAMIRRWIALLTPDRRS